MNATESKAYMELLHQFSVLVQMNSRLVDLVHSLLHGSTMPESIDSGEKGSAHLSANELSTLVVETVPGTQAETATLKAAGAPELEPGPESNPVLQPAGEEAPSALAPRIPTRVCPRCERTLRGTAFEKWHRTCRECEESYKEKKPSREPKAPKRKARNGLADVLEASEIGTCPGCHREGQRLFPPVNGGEKLCYTCRQKLLLDTRTIRYCVICNGEIPATSSPKATICSPDCRKELNRRNNHARYMRLQAAKAS